jgi:hypothetical protein
VAASGTILKDKGWEKIRRQLLEPEKHVVIGIVKDEPHKGTEGATVADVATWNHFGTSNIPARPFISATVDANEGPIGSLIRRLAKGVLEGKIQEKQALGLIGEFILAKIVGKINDFFPPENAQSTIDKKGSSKPLIDTGQLKGSINYEVRED